MPTVSWLKKEFGYGYDSGNVTSLIPNRVRRGEEKKIGGSYRRVFFDAIKPYVKADSNVMELGPGRGAWSRAILSIIPEGTLSTIDYQDVSEWLEPERYGGRLICNQVYNNTFSCIADDSIDFFWSMGVLCHNNQTDIAEVLTNAFSKMRRGAYACHQFGDWKKLDQYGWERGGVPEEFQEMQDDEIWWPRNSTDEMVRLAKSAGWSIATSDVGLLKRDGLMLLQKK